MSVAVVIPLYNGRSWIRETVAAIKAQELPASEIVIVDDGSTDDSPDLVRTLDGVRLVRNSLRGPAGARLTGLRQTTAPLLAFLDQDDLWHPAHLRLLVAALKRHDSAAVAFSRVHLFQDGQAVGYHMRSGSSLYDPWVKFPWGCAMPTPSAAVIRRSALLAADGGWVEAYGGMSDLALWFRLGATAPFVALDAQTTGHRKHLQSHSVALRTEGDKILARHGEMMAAQLPFRLEAATSKEERARLRRRSAALAPAGDIIRLVWKSRIDAPLVEEPALRLESLIGAEPPAYIGGAVGHLVWYGCAPPHHEPTGSRGGRRELYVDLYRAWPAGAPHTRAALALRALASTIQSTEYPALNQEHTPELPPTGASRCLGACEKPQPIDVLARGRQAAVRWWRRSRAFVHAHRGRPGLVVKEAQKLLDRGHLEAAERAFSDVCRRYPHKWKGWVGWAEVAKTRGDAEACLRRWERAREHHPNQLKAWVSGGRLLMDLGRLDEAERVFDEVRRRWPKDWKGWSGWARVAQARGDHVETLKRWEKAREHHPNRPQIGIAIGRTLGKLGRIEEAEQVLGDACRQWPEQWNGWAGWAGIAEVRGCLDESLKRWERARQHHPDQPRAWVEVGRLLSQLGRLDEADRAFEGVCRRWPSWWDGWVSWARTASARGCTDECLSRWQQACEHHPNEPKARIQTGRALAELGRFDEADEVLDWVRQRWPDDWEGWAAWAKTAETSRRWREAQRRWQLVSERFAQQSQAVKECVRAFCRFRDLERAKPLCTAPPLSPVDLLDSRLTLLAHASDLEAVRTTLAEAGPEFARGPKRMAFMARVEAACGHRQAAAAILRDAVRQVPFDSTLNVQLSQTLIAAGQDTEALDLIRRIHPCLESRLDVAHLKAWEEMVGGRAAAAKQRIDQALESHYVGAVHAPIAALERLRSPEVPGEARIKLFACARDERHRLPWFLEYYRRLGVDRFHIVDNDSGDGSREYLQKQPDVELYWTPDSFAEASYGIRWINHLIESHGAGAWCLFVDLDEMLLFPGSETHTLVDLVQYLQDHSYDALRAPMLDLAAEPLCEGAAYREGDDPFEVCPFFDPRHQVRGYHLAPYRQVDGGLRRLLFGRPCVSPLVLVKSPLIRGDAGIRYLSNHTTTPAVVADVTGVLAHFKYLGAFEARAAIEAGRLEHSVGAREYVSYLRHSDVSADHRYPEPVQRYRDSAQLVDLGLVEAGRFGPRAVQPRDSAGGMGALR